MSDALIQFHFLNPEWLLALIPLLILIFVLWRQTLRSTNWQKACDAHLLPHLLTEPANKKKRSWSLLLIGFTGFLIVIALAAPTWSRLPTPVYQSLFSRVIVLDLSNYMEAHDLQPSRIAHARFKVIDLLNALPDNRFGMVAFTSEPFVVSPLTQDKNTISLLVPSLQTGIMPTQGSDIAAALEQAQKLLQQANATNGDIILLTASPVQAKDIAMANKLHHQGIAISVLGMATPQGGPIAMAQGGFLTDSSGDIVISKLDNVGLQQLAAAGGGRYSAYTADDQDINFLIRPNVEQQLALQQQARLSRETTDVWRDQGRWFLLIAMGISLLAFRRGWLEEILR